MAQLTTRKRFVRTLTGQDTALIQAKTGASNRRLS